METGIYVALSGQIAAQQRLDTIAHNVANASTPGFRAEEVTFSTVVSDKGRSPVEFLSSGEHYISRQSGPIVGTGNPLDVAVAGNAWFALETPNGLAYTKDGRLSISSEGQVQSVGGYTVVDRGGAPIVINPKGGPITIAADGIINQDGIQRGAIGLFSISDDAKLTRMDGSSLRSDVPGDPIVDFNSVAVRQGFVEQSNVNAFLELTQMIDLTRNFDAVSTSLEKSEKSLKEAIRTLGGGA